jgi:hypothetical protein
VKIIASAIPFIECDVVGRHVGVSPDNVTPKMIPPLRLVKQVIQWIGAEGVARLADRTSTRRCHFEDVLVHIDANGVPRVFTDKGDGGVAALRA